MMRKLMVGSCVTTIALALLSTSAAAHPLGNFTINIATALRIAPDGIAVDVAVDLAEIPTLQIRPQIDANGDDMLRDDELTTYRDRECARFADATRMAVDGAAVPLRSQGRSITVVGGLAGLSTLRFTCRLRGGADLASRPHTITLESNYASGRVGWHEVTARGDGMILDSSSVPETSPTDALTSYPAGSLTSPPDVRRAEMRAHAGGERLAPDDDAAVPSIHASSLPGVDRATRSFAGLIASRDLTLRLGLLSVAIAFVLGIFHAVAPGHGKTVMAAYIVGQRGTLRQALGVGATVTFTHTAGVLALGLLISVSTVAAPDRLYPWLGALSGLLLASIGLGLLLRARRMRRSGLPGLWHSHAPGAPGHHVTHDHHAHDHHAHDHHAHDHHAPAPAPAPAPTIAPTVLGWRWIVAMGFAGGMVPSPSALVVLLGAVALGRTWFGVGLVCAYGLGMAFTLVAAGLILVRARVHIERIVVSDRGVRAAQMLAVMPVITALVIVVGGLLVTARAVQVI